MLLVLVGEVKELPAELLPDELVPVEVDEPLRAEGCRSGLLLLAELLAGDPELELLAGGAGLARFFSLIVVEAEVVVVGSR